MDLKFRLRRVCLKTKKITKIIVLDNDKILRIGRHSQNDVCLISTENELLISRWHAQIRPTNTHDGSKCGGFTMHDSSMNGTYINDIRITGVERLKEGDIITFGHLGGHTIAPGQLAPLNLPPAEFQFVFEKISENIQNDNSNVCSRQSHYFDSSFTGQIVELPTAMRVGEVSGNLVKQETSETEYKLLSDNLNTTRCHITMLNEKLDGDNHSSTSTTQPTDIVKFLTMADVAVCNGSTNTVVRRMSISKTASCEKTLPLKKRSNRDEKFIFDSSSCVSENPVPNTVFPAITEITNNVLVAAGCSRKNAIDKSKLLKEKKKLSQSKQIIGKVLPVESKTKVPRRGALKRSLAGHSSGRSNKRKKDDISCSSYDCERPQSDTVTWVQCDDCDSWYHTDCAGCAGHDLARLQTAEFHCGCS